jgi:tetratricopeptide (TPR) repeat protein
MKKFLCINLLLLFSFNLFSQDGLEGKTEKELNASYHLEFFRENYDKCLKLSKRLIKINPDSAEYYIYRANLFHYKNNYDSLKFYLQKALEKGYDTLKVYHEYARFHEMKSEKYELALKYINKMIDIKPDSSELYIERGGIKGSHFEDVDGYLEDLRIAAEMGNQSAKNLLKQFKEDLEYMRKQDYWEE